MNQIEIGQFETQKTHELLKPKLLCSTIRPASDFYNLLSGDNAITYS